MADKTATLISPAAPGLADRLKHATARLHREAERSGFINDLLARRATRARYVLFLRNLLPVYEALEAALQSHAERHGPLQVLANPALYRSAAIVADLAQLQGPDWASTVALLDAGSAYAARVAAAAGRGDGVALAGHAYVRYLGDLNGGQILARRLSLDLHVPDAALRTYAFPMLTDPKAFATRYRSAIDRLVEHPRADVAAIETEAVASFACAITLAKAVT